MGSLFETELTGDLLRSARALTSHGGLSTSQAMMAASAPMLIQKAVVEGDPDKGLMTTGLVARRVTDLPSCRQLVHSIVEQARDRLSALCALDRAEGSA